MRKIRIKRSRQAKPSIWTWKQVLAWAAIFGLALVGVWAFVSYSFKSAVPAEETTASVIVRGGFAAQVTDPDREIWGEFTKAEENSQKCLGGNVAYVNQPGIPTLLCRGNMVRTTNWWGEVVEIHLEANSAILLISWKRM